LPTPRPTAAAAVGKLGKVLFPFFPSFENRVRVSVRDELGFLVLLFLSTRKQKIYNLARL
jgi:hypothetical protein